MTYAEREQVHWLLRIFGWTEEPGTWSFAIKLTGPSLRYLLN